MCLDSRRRHWLAACEGAVDEISPLHHRHFLHVVLRLVEGEMSRSPPPKLDPALKKEQTPHPRCTVSVPLSTSCLIKIIAPLALSFLLSHPQASSAVPKNNLSSSSSAPPQTRLTVVLRRAGGGAPAPIIGMKLITWRGKAGMTVNQPSRGLCCPSCQLTLQSPHSSRTSPPWLEVDEGVRPAVSRTRIKLEARVKLLYRENYHCTIVARL